MTKNGSGSKPKTAAELRDALNRLDEERAGYVMMIADAEQAIKQCARQIFDGDSEAAEKRKGHKMRRNTARDALEQIDMILPDLQHELDEAIAAEAQAAREKDAAEAEKFGEILPHLFAECDRRFAEFRRSFTAAIDAVNEARSRGWNVPSQELLQSKLVRALKTSLSGSELRMLDMSPLPSPERCTFSSLGESYALAICGGAKHSVLPPKPTPQPTPQQAATPDERKLPKQFDIGMRLPGDGPDFEVRIATGR